MALTPRRSRRRPSIVTETAAHIAAAEPATVAPAAPPVSPAPPGDGPVTPVAHGAESAVAGVPLAEMAASAGLERVHVIAWRDLDDPEAGGSEVHAANIAAAWAAAGIDVTMRTSSAAGHPKFTTRDGYRAVRKSGRYSVFPRTAVSGALGRTGGGDGLVEIWNGMPFFSPLWSRCPTIVLLHHVHAEMWRMVLKPAALARIGELIEFKLAPPVYRRSHILTLSTSAKEEIVELLGIPSDHIDVVPPGISPSFRPGPARSPHPLVLAVGRLVPVKRFHILVDAMVALKERQPALEAVIVGEGYERPALEAQVHAAGAEPWLRLPGRLEDSELRSLYQRAWVLASTSLREGWGMTITEAAACGTPAVATDIAGHHDAVSPGRSGLLVPPSGGMPLVDALDDVLRDERLRERLGAGAVEHAGRFTWEASARSTLEALCTEARRRRARG
jgi:glycosyltransferase involved in cell wall biosynthesis